MERDLKWGVGVNEWMAMTAGGRDKYFNRWGGELRNSTITVMAPINC